MVLFFRCKLLVVGGGTGGCSAAWRFSRKLKPSESIILLEPSEYHYYQPAFTLVGAGQQYKSCCRPVASVLPGRVRWLRDCAECFDPGNNLVTTNCGRRIYYDYMVVALGVKNDYDKITGLKRALDDPKSGVATIYSPNYCYKTWCALSNLKGGHAVFTFNPQGAKCPGAAQKIMYLADDIFIKNKVKQNISITYNTGGPEIFGIPKFARVLSAIAKRRNIAVNCSIELREVTDREAVFLDKCGETITVPYNFLHVTPPMSPPSCLTSCSQLVTPEYFLDVDQYSLQHKSYCNIFGVGDCISAPNSKTAAAISKQSAVMEENLYRVMCGDRPTARYDGYGACPILTGRNKAVLAEFLYEKTLRETFPFDQSKESRFLSFIIKNLLPRIYWNQLIKGTYNGPEKFRKLFNPLGK